MSKAAVAGAARHQGADGVPLDRGGATSPGVGRRGRPERAETCAALEARSLQGDHRCSSGRVSRAQRRAAVPVSSSGRTSVLRRSGEARRARGLIPASGGAGAAVRDPAGAPGPSGPRPVPAAVGPAPRADRRAGVLPADVAFQYYERQTMAVLLRGLESVFHYFQGLRLELLCDEMKAVIIEDGRDFGSDDDLNSQCCGGWKPRPMSGSTAR